jgi:hypothetical protein
VGNTAYSAGPVGLKNDLSVSSYTLSGTYSHLINFGPSLPSSSFAFTSAGQTVTSAHYGVTIVDGYVPNGVYTYVRSTSAHRVDSAVTGGTNSFGFHHYSRNTHGSWMV